MVEIFNKGIKKDEKNRVRKVDKIKSKTEDIIKIHVKKRFNIYFSLLTYYITTRPGA